MLYLSGQSVNVNWCPVTRVIVNHSIAMQYISFYNAMTVQWPLLRGLEWHNASPSADGLCRREQMASMLVKIKRSTVSAAHPCIGDRYCLHWLGKQIESDCSPPALLSHEHVP